VPNITADLIYTGSLGNSDTGLQLLNNNCQVIDQALANPN